MKENKFKCQKEMCRKKRRHMIMTNIIRFLLVSIFIRGIIVNDHTQDFIIIATFALTYYPSILEKRFGVYLPIQLQTIITLFIFAAQYLGEMHNFYDLIPWWDTVLHTTSGVLLGIIGFMFVYLLNEKGKNNAKFILSPIFVLLFAFCFSMTMAVFWEFFEFSMDRLFATNMQKFRFDGQDGLFDTMTDLFVAMIGTLFSMIGGWVYMKKHKDVLLTAYFETWFDAEGKEHTIQKTKNTNDECNKDCENCKHKINET